MGEIAITLNGARREVEAGLHVADLLVELSDTRGIAVALDGEVVPRSQWGTRQLEEGVRVEVVTAVQGG